MSGDIKNTRLFDALPKNTPHIVALILSNSIKSAFPHFIDLMKKYIKCGGQAVKCQT